MERDERRESEWLKDQMRQAATVFGWGRVAPTEISEFTGRELSLPRRHDPQTLVMYRYRDYTAAMRVYQEHFDRRGLMLREVTDDLEMLDDWPVQWTTEHYRALVDLYGTREYYRTRHWKQVSAQQRAAFPACNRCGSSREAGKTLDAHHANGYECVGAERIGIDLETLCRACHDDEHRQVKPIKP